MSMNAPSYQAMVPKLVKRDDLTNAIALNSAQFNMSRILGPTLGGYAMVLFGVAGNFFLNGLSFLAVLWALLHIRYPEEKPAPHQSMWASLQGRIRLRARDRQMFILVWMTATASLLGIPISHVHPLLCESAIALWRERSWMAAGGLWPGSGAGRDDSGGDWHDSPSRRGAYFCGRRFLSAAIIAFSYSQSFALSECLAFFEGFSGILMISCFNVSIQHLSSDEMRGRVMSIYATSFLGLPPLGSLMAGEIVAPHSHRTCASDDGRRGDAVVFGVLRFFASAA